jgi:hypothetical protein
VGATAGRRPRSPPPPPSPPPDPCWPPYRVVSMLEQVRRLALRQPVGMRRVGCHGLVLGRRAATRRQAGQDDAQTDVCSPGQPSWEQGSQGTAEGVPGSSAAEAAQRSGCAHALNWNPIRAVGCVGRRAPVCWHYPRRADAAPCGRCRPCAVPAPLFLPSCSQRAFRFKKSQNAHQTEK